MNALYFCQEWSGLLLTALASFATVMQMGATLLVLEQRPLTSQRVARDILEGACFAQLFVLAWVIAQFQGSMGGGFVPDNRCEGLRTGIFGLVCITALICAACFQMRCAVLPMTMGSLTIPRAEALFGKMFPTVLGIALLFWLVRATALCVRRLRERKNGFSVRSVKEAMDSLPDGLLFYAADGYIILVNQRMQQ